MGWQSAIYILFIKTVNIMEKDITALITNYIRNNNFDIISEQSEYIDYTKRLRDVGILNTEEYQTYQKLSYNK